MTTSKRRLPSTIWDTTRPLASASSASVSAAGVMP